MVYFILQLSASLVVVFYFLRNCTMTAAPGMMLLFKLPSVYLAWAVSNYYIPPIWEEGKKVLQSGMEQDSVRSCFAKFQRETFS